MIRVIAKFQLKQENADKALEIVKPLIELTRKEKGCIQYDLARSITDENVLVILETWEDQESLDIHSASEHFGTYVPKLGDLCQCAPTVDNFIQII